MNQNEERDFIIEAVTRAKVPTVHPDAQNTIDIGRAVLAAYRAQNTNTTASIDLAQLDKLEALTSVAGNNGWYGIYQLADGVTDNFDGAFIAAANPATVQQLIALARRSLTSGAPAAPLYEAALLAVERMRGCAATYIEDHAKDTYPGAIGLRPQDVATMWAKEIHGIDAKVYLDEAIDDLSAGAAAKTDHAPSTGKQLFEAWVSCNVTVVNPPKWDDLSDSTQVHWNKQAIYGGTASAAGAGSAQPRDVCAEMRALCSSCGGTGDVHSIDGEWRGECNCPEGISLTLERLKIAAKKTQSENEELRAELAQFQGAQPRAEGDERAARAETGTQAWEYSFIHSSAIGHGESEVGPCLTYHRADAYGVGCMKQREILVFTAAKMPCGACDGTGRYAPESTDECEECKGTGTIHGTAKEWK